MLQISYCWWLFMISIENGASEKRRVCWLWGTIVIISSIPTSYGFFVINGSVRAVEWDNAKMGSFRALSALIEHSTILRVSSETSWANIMSLTLFSQWWTTAVAIWRSLSWCVFNVSCFFNIRFRRRFLSCLSGRFFTVSFSRFVRLGTRFLVRICSIRLSSCFCRCARCLWTWFSCFRRLVCSCFWLVVGCGFWLLVCCSFWKLVGCSFWKFVGCSFWIGGFCSFWKLICCSFCRLNTSSTFGLCSFWWLSCGFGRMCGRFFSKTSRALNYCRRGLSCGGLWRFCGCAK